MTDRIKQLESKIKNLAFPRKKTTLGNEETYESEQKVDSKHPVIKYAKNYLEKTGRNKEKTPFADMPKKEFDKFIEGMPKQRVMSSEEIKSVLQKELASKPWNKKK